MVMGAYHPEMTGGANQCRTLARALRGHARIAVLSVSNDASLASEDVVDDVQVVRVIVDPRRRASKARGAFRLVWTFVRMCRAADIVHLHGYTRKLLVLVPLAKLLGKPVLLKTGGVGQDDPITLRERGVPFRLAYAGVNGFIASSPAVEQSLLKAGVPAHHIERIANGVELDRFSPATVDERRRLRAELELPQDGALILCVGMMAAVKRPDLLFEAWATLGCLKDRSALVFCTTRSGFHEIDSGISDRIRARAAQLGCSSRVMFVEPTFNIEKFYRAVDMYVLPSAQEGLPNALLEAMASGLPCVASHLPGITDTVIESGKNGMLIESGDVECLASALRVLLCDSDRAEELGRQARATIARTYGIDRTASAHVALYHRVLA